MGNLFTTQSWTKIQGTNFNIGHCPLKFGFPARFTDAKVLLGNQQQLMQLISSGELDMAGLNDYTAKELNEILAKIGIEKKDVRRY